MFSEELYKLDTIIVAQTWSQNPSHSKLRRDKKLENYKKNRSCVTLICCSFVICYTSKLGAPLDTFVHDPAWCFRGPFLLAWFNWDYEMDKQPDP